MSGGRFVTTLIAAGVALCPIFFMAWVYVVATVNFHDVLMVACVLCVQWHVHGIRRDRREVERQVRAEIRRRSLNRMNEVLTDDPEDERIPV